MNKLHNVFDKRINFVPEIILKTRARRVKSLAAIIIVLLLALALLGPVIQMNNYNDEAVEKIITLQMMYNDYKIKADDVRLLERETEEIEAKQLLLDQVAKNSKIWGPVLQVVADSVPGEMWFYNFELQPYGNPEAEETAATEGGTTTPAGTEAGTTEGGQSAAVIPSADKIPEGRTSVIAIKGGAQAVDTVGKFMYKLNTLYNFGRVELKSITRSTENNTIDFELQIILEEEVGRGA